MRRVQQLSQHLCAGSSQDDQQEQQQVKSPSVTELVAMLEDRTKLEDRQALLRALPSSEKELGREAAMLEFQRASEKGSLHLRWFEWSKKFGNGDPGTNFMFPSVFSPRGAMPYVDYMVVVAHPDDAQRLTRAHVRKSDTYGIAFLGDGVLSTRDVGSWRQQREHLVESFLPHDSLGKILPISAERARFAAAEKLMRECEGGRAELNINEFFLYEAMAQLQLALLGESKEYMEETNKPLRESFKGALTVGGDLMEAQRARTKARRVVHKYSNTLLQRAEHSGLVSAREGFEDSSKTVKGPVTAQIASMCPVMNGQVLAKPEAAKIQRDCASTFLFAGHDTTASLMVHVIFHICEHPRWQLLLQQEADAFFAAHPQGYSFDDLQHVPQLKKVLLETLRISPSVPNGTFREVQFDDYLLNADGDRVPLKKGTQFVVPVWNLHHSEQLWGPDAGQFNPDREWLPEENWGGEDKFLAYAPASRRYCPFTFGPRDCLGKAFALMEARIILLELLHRFDFKLAGQSVGKPLSEIDANVGTLGPKNGLFVTATPRTLA